MVLKSINDSTIFSFAFMANKRVKGNPTLHRYMIIIVICYFFMSGPPSDQMSSMTTILQSQHWSTVTLLTDGNLNLKLIKKCIAYKHQYWYSKQTFLTVSKKA